MKRIFFILLLLSPSIFATANKPLSGKVRVVSSLADYRVRIVSSFPDLLVRKVDRDPKTCGEWRFVTSHEDFTIQFVTSHEDFSIKYTDFFPGLPNGKSRLKDEKKSDSTSNGDFSNTAGGTKLQIR